MRVLLIASNTQRINMVTVPLGLGLVAAATRQAGHQVEFLDLLGARDPTAVVAAAVRAHRPDVIGISVRNIDDQVSGAPRFLLEQVAPVVAACRATTSAPVVLGGPGFSIFPDAVLAFLGADFGVTGDGEAVFPALLEHLCAGLDPGVLPGVHLAGRQGARPPTFAERLDSLPSWDESLDALAASAGEQAWLPVQTRRGCPNDCSYCSTFLIQGRAIRARDAASVADLVARLARRGHRRVFFVDNSFNIPAGYALALCAALRERACGTEWRAIVYPHMVDEQLAAAMANAGCSEISLGFESGCDRVLANLGKRFRTDDVRSATRLFAAHGVRVMGFLLLGGPGETRDSVEQSLAFAASLPLASLRVTAGIRIYPGTALAQQACAEGQIAPTDDLLRPRFYLAPGLEGWIEERLARFS